MLATGETIRQVLPHARSPEEVARELGSDPDQGLNREAAATSRRGRAEPASFSGAAGLCGDRPAPARRSTGGAPAGASAVSAAIGEQLEAAVIAAIVVLNAVLGFFQEAGAERAVLALRSSVQPTAAVVRDGREHQVPAEELVPGDLVVLREGDRVPADARLVAARRSSSTSRR